MWRKLKSILFRLDICLLLINTVPDSILGLKNVSVTVPKSVRKGDNAHLICNYDMEGDTLYSVKWYKGRREFYRYTPKENPSMKTFIASGINVENALSNQSHVILTSIQLNNTGKFSCEVSADAPSFHTVIVSGDMEVVEIPEQKPSLTGIHSRYRIGDQIIGNCTSYYSKPAANLTWTINDIPALSHQVKFYPINRNPLDNLEISVAELNIFVLPKYFIRGRLKLKCIARIYDIYEQDIEKIIEEDRPRILASGRSPDVSLFPSSSSYDQQQQTSDSETNNEQNNELQLIHYKADITSSASSVLSSSSSFKPTLPLLRCLHQKIKPVGIEMFNILLKTTTAATSATAAAVTVAAATVAVAAATVAAATAAAATAVTTLNPSILSVNNVVFIKNIVNFHSIYTLVIPILIILSVCHLLKIQITTKINEKCYRKFKKNSQKFECNENDFKLKMK